MIVLFHMLYYVANIIWNKFKPKLLAIEDNDHKLEEDITLNPGKFSSWKNWLEKLKEKKRSFDFIKDLFPSREQEPTDGIPDPSFWEMI